MKVEILYSHNTSKLPYFNYYYLTLKPIVIWCDKMNDFTKKNLKEELIKILDNENRKQLFEDYYELETILGGKGASEKVAKQIISDLKIT